MGRKNALRKNIREVLGRGEGLLVSNAMTAGSLRRRTVRSDTISYKASALVENGRDAGTRPGGDRLAIRMEGPPAGPPNLRPERPGSPWAHSTLLRQILDSDGLRKGNDFNDLGRPWRISPGLAQNHRPGGQTAAADRFERAAGGALKRIVFQTASPDFRGGGFCTRLEV